MISRDEAIKILSRRNFHCSSCANSLVGDCGDCILNSALDMAVQALEENEFLEDLKGGCAGCRIITKLDQARRPKGRWIIDGHHIRCNRCNESICNTDREGDKIPDNFCPNCGANMR
jgi:hypothetical protein